jgi:hypothetical protein
MYSTRVMAIETYLNLSKWLIDEQTLHKMRMAINPCFPAKMDYMNNGADKYSMKAAVEAPVIIQEVVSVEGSDSLPSPFCVFPTREVDVTLFRTVAVKIYFTGNLTSKYLLYRSFD